MVIVYLTDRRSFDNFRDVHSDVFRGVVERNLVVPSMTLPYQRVDLIVAEEFAARRIAEASPTDRQILLELQGNNLYYQPTKLWLDPNNKTPLLLSTNKAKRSAEQLRNEKELWNGLLNYTLPFGIFCRHKPRSGVKTGLRTHFARTKIEDMFLEAFTPEGLPVYASSGKNGFGSGGGRKGLPDYLMRGYFDKSK